MILLRAGMFHILKCFFAGALSLAITISFLLTYAYVGGDRTDREEMHQAAGQFASYFRIVPPAEAATSRQPSSQKF